MACCTGSMPSISVQRHAQTLRRLSAGRVRRTLHRHAGVVSFSVSSFCMCRQRVQLRVQGGDHRRVRRLRCEMSGETPQELVATGDRHGPGGMRYETHLFVGKAEGLHLTSPSSRLRCRQ